jgi:hypothetical protein
MRIWWGTGAKDGSFYPMLDHAVGTDWTVSVWTTGGMTVEFGNLARKHDRATAHPFADRAKRLDLLRRLNAVPGVSLPQSAVDRYPSIPLAALADQAALDACLAALRWLVAELRDATPPQLDTR